MAEIELPSLIEQLKSLVKREFPNYIPVPSLAESSMFNTLCFCSPNEPEKKSWAITEAIKKKLAWNQDSGCLAKFVSLGFFFDHCEEDPNDRVKEREDPVCIHGCQATGSQEINANMKGEVPSLAGFAGGLALIENTKKLDLGKIVKSSLSHKQINYWLKRITSENSPMLIREAKKRHLFIIYEVLLAERLVIEEKQSSNTKLQGYASGEAKSTETKYYMDAKGTGNWKRKSDCRLSRPKSMGRYPIAFKCGRARFKKSKKHLQLVGLKEFYEPFQFRHQNESSDQSQSPPEHEDQSL